MKKKMTVSGKCLLCLVFFYAGIRTGCAQSNNWLLGEWKGIGIVPGSDYSTVFIRTLKINIQYKNRFSGLLIQEVMNDKSIRIEKEVGGSMLNEDLQLVTGRTLYKKQPLHGFWADCSSCKSVTTRLSVSSDSLMLTSETRGCGNYCDGYTTYYKPLSDFDTATQRKLVQQFGSPLLAKIFIPVMPVVKTGDRPLPATAKTASRVKPPAITATDNRKTPPVAGEDAAQFQLSRKNKTIATYDVSAAVIKIELFDNGEIDGDTVTVYHNKQKIIDRQLLGLQPIVYSVKAGAQDRVHEFILVANNLGRIPPNTALMRVTAGDKTYELFASTNLTENASVIIIYSGQ